MKQAFLKFEHWTTGFSMLVACLMLVIASTLGMFQIVTRFVLEQPAEWSEILIRLSLIWMVFMGIPMAFRQGAMVSVDVLWDYSLRGRVQSMAGLESISMFWGYVAMPVGGMFCVIGLIGNLMDPQRNELETAQ